MGPTPQSSRGVGLRKVRNTAGANVVHASLHVLPAAGIPTQLPCPSFRSALMSLGMGDPLPSQRLTPSLGSPGSYWLLNKYCALSK